MRQPTSFLGHPVSFATAGPEIRGRVAGWRDGFFALDKWQVSRKLTLNYGIRYELPTVPYTINGVASILNADQSALIVATPGFKFIAPQHKNWAPRLGFAYRISEKTVFRGGGGIYYNPNQTNSYTFLNTNPPWSPIFQCNWSSGLPTLSLSNPLGVPAACPLPGSNSGALIVTPPAEQPAGRMNQWSASIDRQLWSGGGLEVQYLGSHSYHLDRSFYNNTPLLPGPGAVNARRPNQKFGPIRTIANDEIANYESMSVIFRHNRRNLHTLVSYTWSHTLDVSTDSNGGGATMNPYWWKADYGNSNWDIRHRVVATFVYDIPFFAVTNPILKGAFANWQANGIVTLQSGLPFNVSTSTDTANTAVERHLPSQPGSRGDRGLRTRAPDRMHRRERLHGRGLISDRARELCVRERRPQHPVWPRLAEREFFRVQEFPDQGTAEVPISLRNVRPVQSHEFRESFGDDQHEFVRQHHERERRPHDSARSQTNVLVWHDDGRFSALGVWAHNNAKRVARDLGHCRIRL